MIAQNVAGMLSYFTFIPAVIFLLMKPYNQNSFVRFHALQSLFFSAAFFVLTICIYVLAYFTAGFFPNPFMFPVFFYFFSAVLGIFSLLCFSLWLVCLVKAFRNDKIKLPVVGDMAEYQSTEI